MDSHLEQLIARARACYETMTPEEREAMDKAQRESWVRAESSWPKPKFKMVDGVKVYESYEDYCNG